MKVIELLNKIANGEEVPKKIQVYNDIFVLDEENKLYEHENTRTNLFSIYNGNILNYKPAIIEEDKKIEPLECYNNAFIKGCMSEYYEEDFEKAVKHNFKVIRNEINEIIDKINKMEDK